MGLLTNCWRRIKIGGIFADVAKLASGTLSGRLISIAVLPILTRLYSPEDFAVLATYLAVLGIIAVAACLRLDIAIPMAKTHGEATNLLALALLALGAVTAIVALLVATMPTRIAIWLGNQAIEPYLWLVPAGIALAGLYSVFQQWTTRMRRFGHIARTRLTQSALGAVTMLSFGWAAVAPFGLLLGNALSIGAGGIGLALGALRSEGRLIKQVSPLAMRSTLRRNYRYPLYSTPEALLNIAGVQVPVLLIAAYAGTAAGFLLLAMQLMAAPMALLGSSVAQVYVSRAPQARQEGNLSTLTLSIMRKLAFLGLGPLILVGALAPHVVPVILGEEWARTGTIIAYMVPWILLQFVVSPVSMVLYVVGQQRSMLVMTALGFVLRAGAVCLGLWVGTDTPVLWLIASSFAYYIVVLAFVLAAIGPLRFDTKALTGMLIDWRISIPLIVSTLLWASI